MLQQLKNGETAQERRQRRDALLSYGRIFTETHRKYGDSDLSVESSKTAAQVLPSGEGDETDT
jgi:hypothetical protein